ncbi:MAG TPA: Wzz/FepE/Etk N-terminal domain-containing protein [Acidobacteriaceae bacterium]|jgi:polysaccharide chain length determinant protein (PEP-CTERM system associated)|nr:Wzz/FepE/Etk N-terminal domain-containing protein [Acidobacteriaceae bacterium]
MAEVYEEEKSKGFDLQRVWDMVQRRHMFFLVPFFMGWLLVFALSFILPKMYKSTTLILVQEPTMPKNYVLSNISDNLQDRLQSITQQLESRTRLLAIISELHLNQRGGRTVSPDNAVDGMQKDITVDLVRDSSGLINAFKVSYSAPSPTIAQKVTYELTTRFINENLQVRQSESQDATKFLQGQMETARQTLGEQEAKVRGFETVHQGELPDQQATNLNILNGLQQQLQGEEDSLRAASQQRSYFQSLVEQYRAAAPVRTADGAPTALATMDMQLQTQRTQLADLSTRYTDAYPDVQNLKGQIAKMEKARAALVAQMKARSGDEAEPASTMENAPLLQAQSQLHATDTEITSRQLAITQLKAKIGDYQTRLNAAPAVQEQLADLNRGYTQSQTDYNDLLKKESDSQMATSMEQMQQGERFTMQDPPNYPMKPDFPNHLKFCGIGVAVGLLLGICLVGGLEYFDDRMHLGEEIRDMIPVAVISEVPEIVTPEDVSRARRRVLVGWATAAVVLITILAGTAMSFLRS